MLMFEIRLTVTQRPVIIVVNKIDLIQNSAASSTSSEDTSSSSVEGNDMKDIKVLSARDPVSVSSSGDSELEQQPKKRRIFMRKQKSGQTADDNPIGESPVSAANQMLKDDILALQAMTGDIPIPDTTSPIPPPQQQQQYRPGYRSYLTSNSNGKSRVFSKDELVGIWKEVGR